MPRNSSGTYSLPSGNPVVSGTLIESSWANNTLSDLASAMTDSLSRSGEGGMTAPLRLADGTVSVPGFAFTNETSTGLYRAGSGDVRLAVTGSEVMRFMTSGVTVATALSATGDFAINTNKFTVAASTGNTAVAGTLAVTGAITATGGVVGNLTGNVTGDVTGNVSGNAGTVTNGVYTTGAQTIGGAKEFSTSIIFPNSVGITAKDSGGTTRSLMYVGSDNYTNIFNAGNVAVRILNQAGSASLVTLSDASGNLTATGNVTAYSDERLKKDWGDLADDFVAQLAKVKVGTYTRIDTGDRQIGVSAQSLQFAAPEAVMQGEHLSVAYGNAALAACVMLARRVQELEAKLGA